jgi:hypothetical protein
VLAVTLSSTLRNETNAAPSAAKKKLLSVISLLFLWTSLPLAANFWWPSYWKLHSLLAGCFFSPFCLFLLCADMVINLSQLMCHHLQLEQKKNID